MNRLKYAIISTIMLAIATFSMLMLQGMEQVVADGGGADERMILLALNVVLLVSTMVFIAATYRRFKNAGINPWWSLTVAIPGVVIGTWLVGLFSKPKAQEVKI